MRLLFVSYTDFSLELGTTAAFWQFFKALYELEVDVHIIPFAGNKNDTPWWTSSQNPCLKEFKVYKFLNGLFKQKSLRSNEAKLPKRDDIVLAYNQKKSTLISISSKILGRKWRKTLLMILSRTQFDAIILFNIPLHFFQGTIEQIQRDIGIPVYWYDGDMPVHLPGHPKFISSIDIMTRCNINEYDGIFSNSQGANKILKELGAQNTYTLHYGVDPQLYFPRSNSNNIKKYDLFFYGVGDQFRADWLREMLLPNKKTLLGGKNMSAYKKGVYQYIPRIGLSQWGRLTNLSKINLNIVRRTHAQMEETSTMRPFELGAFRCCIVSNPYSGLRKWYTEKEIIEVHNKEEYQSIIKELLNNAEYRNELANNAYQRTLKEHTSKKRAETFLNVLRN